MQFLDEHGKVVASVPEGSVGVVGQQPVLEKGQCFEYYSGIGMDTPTGTMEGAYSFLCAPTGSMFKVPIPKTAFVSVGATPSQVAAVLDSVQQSLPPACKRKEKACTPAVESASSLPPTPKWAVPKPHNPSES